ncbi:hypothetical protein OG417_45595 [Actinoallomurus sp. NBC_01490]|uniref:hypothetical protein n=1 Tax=Actinoallomurus sp. NBC_01490 TaxID=2903557 RepID=UPI002E372D5B|nr:hypothetical protein [Actinoallomurus sp. NBC_01490]
MAKRTRGQAQSAWWTGIAALGALALYTGTWRLWALTVLVWCMYELCFCPTRCGVATRDGDPCRNGARGRLYACTNVAGHQQLKTDALWHLPGRRGSLARLRPRYGHGAPSHRKTTSPPSSSEQGYVEPNQRIMAYLAVVCVFAIVIQTAVGLAVL